MTPEYGGDEELHTQRVERLDERSEGLVPDEAEDAPERVVQERKLMDQTRQVINPEDNEAHAAGQRCERCGAVILAGQDVRLQYDGHWVHQVCPVDLGELPG